MNEDLEDLFNEAVSNMPRRYATRVAVPPDSDGSRTCSKCLEKKALRLFNWASQTAADKANQVRRQKTQCKACDMEDYRRWSADKKDAIRQRDRERHYEKKYKLQPEIAALLANAENRVGSCPICRNKATLVMDHDHDSGEVRDLICSACNSLLGYAKENLDTLYMAIQYLKKHRGLG